MSKEYKGWELMKDLAEGNIKKGTQFIDDYGNKFIWEEEDGYFDLFELDSGKKEIPDYSPFADKDNIFTIIEEEPEIDIQKIEEIKDVFIENSTCGEDVKYLARKYNQLVQAVKQLDRQINGDKTGDK